MSQSTQYFAPICIYLIRKGKNASRDDVIKINQNLDNPKLLNVKYLDKDSDKNYSFTDTWDNVAQYLENIFLALPLDEDPFESVQFTLPAYPSLMISVKNLNLDDAFMDTMWDMLKSVVDGWPVSVREEDA